MRIFEDLKYAPGEQAFLDLHLPEQDGFDLLVWFHGGSLEMGSRKDPGFRAQLLEAGVGLASVEYRMYPQAKFPDFLEDSAAAVAWLLEHIEEYGKPGRIFVAGQSAGAYITLMLALDRHYFANAGVDYSRIAGYISDSAQTTTHFNVLRERGLDPRMERIDDAAPLFHVSEQADFGALLLIAYAEDIPCRPEQNRLFYKSLQRLCPGIKAAYHELPGGHCHGSFARNEKGTFDFNDTVLEFLARL